MQPLAEPGPRWPRGRDTRARTPSRHTRQLCAEPSLCARSDERRCTLANPRGTRVRSCAPSLFADALLSFMQLNNSSEHNADGRWLGMRAKILVFLFCSWTASVGASKTHAKRWPADCLARRGGHGGFRPPHGLPRCSLPRCSLGNGSLRSSLRRAPARAARRLAPTAAQRVGRRARWCGRCRGTSRSSAARCSSS